jgi:hypothetical protein
MLVLFYIYIYSIYILPIIIINRIYENQYLLSLQLVSFLVRLRAYQHPCIIELCGGVRRPRYTVASPGFILGSV